ncbi:type IV pili twitching motility protein PilT [Desulfobacter hydrogenophilus]|uniref:Type IV pili twitching motility protein PilT n=1 Tax=Desulfobacter hydrogenophilus TaxID=2291 RepID=A0A328FAF2_9BACT|nr:type IV pilus twitching motility protein PilT [Desulfobacter hydrogenophilus]NDY73626.1 type IV pilus twitching motility protein PilT [Desulfobacter hydrogenophilus]QBH12119.1 type IV pilus twitching motility protein PilT [Desulfobacter hydrogenophilus]RAM00670.1 type IV pili twitching motility protein PilT [Desulfobacter hydrogenophilus]
MKVCVELPFGAEKKEEDIKVLFTQTMKMGASDLHLAANMPPMYRVKGKIVPHPGHAPYSSKEISQLMDQVLTERYRQVLEEKKSVDFAVSINDVGRFRVAIYYQRGSLSAAFRLLAAGIPTFESLGLPESLSRLPHIRDGLVLVTGVTGSGKSTTLATVIHQINDTLSHHIITIEDPIEYVHENRKSIINQRELYSDVPSFASALRDSLRADPDVILVGEMRDLETMRTAIMAAETGHLVFSTLHSRDCVSTINRLVGAFPAGEQPQIRQQLASTLKAVVSQRLLPNAGNTGRIPGVEVMFATPGIANLIRQAKDDMIYSNIETGFNDGMMTMEQHLIKLVKAGKISVETSISAAKNKNLMKQRLMVDQAPEPEEQPSGKRKWFR